MASGLAPREGDARNGPQQVDGIQPQRFEARRASNLNGLPLASRVSSVIERRSDSGARQRFAATCTEVRTLMEQACPGLPSPQLERLVVEMARVQLRYEPLTSPLAEHYFVPRQRH